MDHIAVRTTMIMRKVTRECILISTPTTIHMMEATIMQMKGTTMTTKAKAVKSKRT